MRVRARGIAHETRRPAHHGVARIVGIEVWVLRFRGHIFGDDGVFEAGLLKHFLPILDALFDVAPPARWRTRVDVVHDRFDRLDQFPARIRSRVFGLQSPAGDERLARRLLFVQSVVDTVQTEEAHARIKVAWPHRHLGQQQQ